MNKLDDFRERNYQRHMSRKEKRKEKREKFKNEHPKLYDFAIKAEATGLVIILFGIPYILGRMEKYDEVKTDAELEGRINASNEFLKEYGRPDIDWIDDEGKYHQDLHFGGYAVWDSKEAYLEAEKNRLNNLGEGYPR